MKVGDLIRAKIDEGGFSTVYRVRKDPRNKDDTFLIVDDTGPNNSDSWLLICPDGGRGRIMKLYSDDWEVVQHESRRFSQIAGDRKRALPRPGIALY